MGATGSKFLNPKAPPHDPRVSTREKGNIVITRLLLSMALGLAAVLPASAQTDRVVALVVSVGNGGARADAIQAQLQVMGAESLRSADPNNAELRSMLKRFAAVAANTRASLVYLDMPAVLLEGREFVLPAGTSISRPTDLLTQAVPLSAFARAAVQADQGGGVILAVGRDPEGLPTALEPVEQAPAALTGASPVLVARYGGSDPIVQVIAAMGQETVVDLHDVLRRMSEHDQVTVSDLPSAPTYLKRPPELEVETQIVAAAVPDVETPETVEELQVLEKSLSRSAKRALQRNLRDLGHYKGLVDGIFGPQSRQAITDFQTARAEEPSGFLSRRQLLDLQ